MIARWLARQGRKKTRSRKAKRAIAQFLQNLNARGHKPDQKLSEDVLHTALIGSPVGAGVSAPVAAAVSLRHNVAQGVGKVWILQQRRIGSS